MEGLHRNVKAWIKHILDVIFQSNMHDLQRPSGTYSASILRENACFTVIHEELDLHVSTFNHPVHFTNATIYLVHSHPRCETTY